MRSLYIYALRDPDSDAIRYVGRSVNPRNRMLKHLRKPTPKMQEWASSLKRQARTPGIQILEETTSVNAGEKEIFWICHLIGKGCALLNTNLVPRFKPKRHGPLYCKCGRSKKRWQAICYKC